MQINKIILFIGFCLYAISPQTYSFGICLSCFIAFAFLAWDLLKEDFSRKNYITFNTFFLVSFFFTSFCFPVIIMPSKILYSAFESLSMVVFTFVDFSYITKATALCLIAISIYSIGYKYATRRELMQNEHNGGEMLKLKSTNILLIIAFMAVILNVFLTLRSQDSSTSMSDNPFVYDLFKAIVAVSYIRNSYQQSPSQQGVYSFWRDNKLTIVLSVAVILLFLVLGDRGTSISLTLLTLGCISLYYYRIRLYHLLVIGFLGATVLFAIRQTRKTDSSLASGGLSSFAETANSAIQGQSALFMFSDLIGACQELCIGYKIKEIEGLQNPEQIFLIPLMPFPMLPTLACGMIYNKTYKEMNGSGLINEYMSGMATSRYGSHCVSYVYMRWGLIGTILLFFIFGFVIGRYSCRSIGYSAYYSVAFLLLFSLSIYIPRSSLLDIIRPLFYAYLFTRFNSKNSMS